MSIAASIDVNKIDKSQLFEGKKGKYLDLVLIPTPNNQYGDDFMVVQGLSKEKRDAGERGEILGNAKHLKGNASSDSGSEVAGGPSDDDDSSLPF